MNNIQVTITNDTIAKMLCLSQTGMGKLLIIKMYPNCVYKRPP